MAERHRFSLVYGTAVPGYRDPAGMTEPASEVLRAFLAPALAADGPARPVNLADGLADQLTATAQALALDVPPGRLLALAGAFATLIGLLTLELNGHLPGDFKPAGDLVEVLLQRAADDAGLQAGSLEQPRHPPVGEPLVVRAGGRRASSGRRPP